MKVQIQPGRVVRLTPMINSSLRKGGTYDLDELKVPPEEQKAITELEGVTVVKGGASTKADKGGDS